MIRDRVLNVWFVQINLLLKKLNEGIRDFMKYLKNKNANKLSYLGLRTKMLLCFLFHKICILLTFFSNSHTKLD